jgi:hypothetical protein
MYIYINIHTYIHTYEQAGISWTEDGYDKKAWEDIDKSLVVLGAYMYMSHLVCIHVQSWVMSVCSYLRMYICAVKQQNIHTWTRTRAGQQQSVWRAVVEEDSGGVYFWNTLTDETLWERPPELLRLSCSQVKQGVCLCLCLCVCMGMCMYGTCRLARLRYLTTKCWNDITSVYVYTHKNTHGHHTSHPT